MISPKNLGLAGGVLCGVKLFLLTLISVSTGYAHNILSMLSDVYPGYTVTPGGSVIGLIYGFIVGFVMLFILAWLYDKFCGYCVSCADRTCKTHLDKTDAPNDKPKEWK